MKPLLLVLSVTLAATAGAMEWKDVRVGPQALIGSSGFEPGAFAEFTWDTFRLRPELFLQDWDRPGAGVAALWQLPVSLLPGHTLHVGPRFAYHNGEHGDDPRAELSAMAIYNLPLPPKQADSRHNLEAIVATGLVDANGTEFAFSVGAGYLYRF